MDKLAKQREQLNIGVLGSGFMGKMRSHAYSVIGTIFEDLDLVPNLYAVASLDDKNLDGFASRFGFQYQTDNWRELIDDPQISVVTICLPEHLHREAAVAALEAGKHVFCEKALAQTLEDGRAMVAAAGGSRGLSMLGFNYRFLPAVQLARELIQRDLLGRLYSVDCRYYQESGHDPDRPAEDVSYAIGPKALGSAQGLGSHAVDTMRFLIGEIHSVQAILKTHIPTRMTKAGETLPVHVDDSAAMLVEFANSVIGTISTSKVAIGRKNQFRFEINGSKGSLAYDAEESNYLDVYLDNRHPLELRGFTRVNVTEKDHPLMKYWWPPAHNLGWEHSHINEMHHFVMSIQENKAISPLGGTFEDGLQALLLLEGAKQATREGKRVLLETLH